MSNTFQLRPTHFFRGGAKKFAGGIRPPVPPWLRACIGYVSGKVNGDSAQCISTLGDLKVTCKKKAIDWKW